MAGEEVRRVRSVGIIGQGAAGKTTLGEAMLFAAGAISRMGRVEEGTTSLDVEPEETKRQISLTPGFHHLTWQKCEVTLVDTPGYANFLAETRACLRAVTGTVLVASPTSDFKFETERIWNWVDEERLPVVVFVSRMDRERAALETAVEDLKKALGARVAVLHHPIGREAEFRGIVDLLTMRAHVVDGAGGKAQVVDVPADVRDEVDAARSRLAEAVAEV